MTLHGCPRGLGRHRHALEAPSGMFGMSGIRRPEIPSCFLWSDWPPLPCMLIKHICFLAKCLAGFCYLFCAMERLIPCCSVVYCLWKNNLKRTRTLDLIFRTLPFNRGGGHFLHAKQHKFYRGCGQLNGVRDQSIYFVGSDVDSLSLDAEQVASRFSMNS